MWETEKKEMKLDLLLICCCDSNCFSFRIVVTIRSLNVGHHRYSPGKHHGDNQTQENSGPDSFSEKSNAVVAKQ